MSIEARRSEGSLRAARRPRVELPPANSEQLRAPKLVAIGAASISAGLVLVLALSSRTHAPTAAERTAEASHASAIDHAPQPPAASHAPPVIADAGPKREALAPSSGPTMAVSAAATEPAPIAPIVPRDERARVEDAPAVRAQPADRAQAAMVAPAEPATATPAAAAEAPAPEPEDATTASDAPTEGARVKIEMGQVAYLRCDGLAPKKRGAFPCPRDRALEKSIRDILETLERCRVADALGRGRFEVRLELTTSGSRPDLDVRAPSEAGERAVRACAGPALARVTTVLRPERMIVAQRFNVR